MGIEQIVMLYFILVGGTAFSLGILITIGGLLGLYGLGSLNDYMKNTCILLVIIISMCLLIFVGRTIV